MLVYDDGGLGHYPLPAAILHIGGALDIRENEAKANQISFLASNRHVQTKLYLPSPTRITDDKTYIAHVCVHLGVELLCCLDLRLLLPGLGGLWLLLPAVVVVAVPSPTVVVALVGSSLTASSCSSCSLGKRVHLSQPSSNIRLTKNTQNKEIWSAMPPNGNMTLIPVTRDEWCPTKLTLIQDAKRHLSFLRLWKE